MQEHLAWMMREWPVCAWVLIISYTVLIAGIACLPKKAGGFETRPYKKRFWISGLK